jgi:translation elongation factor EF-Tu-like GTPase
MTNQKVGHVKKEIAKALAQVMDSLGDVKIDGTIPYAGNAYTLPCLTEVYGKDSADQKQVDTILKRHGMRWKMNNQVNHDVATMDSTNTAVEVTKKSMDWQSSQKNLDDMFEQISKDQLANLPDIAMPSVLTAETLFDHQVQGIRWLYQHETGTKQVPFFKKVKESGKNVWFSEITNSSQPTAPKPVKGSIL